MVMLRYSYEHKDFSFFRWCFCFHRKNVFNVSVCWPITPFRILSKGKDSDDEFLTISEIGQINTIDVCLNIYKFKLMNSRSKKKKKTEMWKEILEC